MKILSNALWFLQITYIASLPLKKSHQVSELIKRRSRSTSSYIGCIQMAVEEGHYKYISQGVPNVCGFYIIASPQEIIEIEFTMLNVNCQTGIAVVVDGWEQNKQFFPSPTDHAKSLQERHQELCGRVKQRVYIASQNVALIQHLIPMPGEGFAVNVRFIKNPQPCNVVSLFDRGIYTLKNYGEKRNCSLSMIYPERVQLLTVDVGVTGRMKVKEGEYGLKTQCQSIFGGNDHVEIAGSNSFEVSSLNRRAYYCGMDSKIDEDAVIVGCQNTIVRLVSSGSYYNSVTFMYSSPSEEELGQVDPNKCQA